MLGRVLRDLLRGRRGAYAPALPSSPKADATNPSAAVTMRYRSDVFDVANATQARDVILTPEGGQSTDERWARETPYLVALAIDELGLRQGTRVIDFGCGIGRLARELVARSGCAVTGVDISDSMRRLAQDYVRSPSFEAIDPATLDARTAAGEHADAAIACWVLQHGMDPGSDIDALARALRPGGRLLVVNNVRRAVPADQGWVDDRLDIAALLDARFRRIKRHGLDEAVVGPVVAQHAFVAVYERS